MFLALKCYICTTNANSLDTKCIDDQDLSNPSMNCPKKYCIIYRQELLDPPGKVNSFSRSCEDEPTVS